MCVIVTITVFSYFNDAPHFLSFQAIVLLFLTAAIDLLLEFIVLVNTLACNIPSLVVPLHEYHTW